MNTKDLYLTLSQLAERASLSPDIEAVIFVELTGDDPAHWQGRISGGRLNMDQGRPETSDLTVTAASDTAIKIFTKEMNPMAAFMTGKIKVQGDMTKLALLKDFIMGKKK